MRIKFEKKYLNIAVLSFLVIVASILVLFMLLRFEIVYNTLTFITSILSPVIIGFVFAYLLTPILNFYEKFVLHKIFKNNSKKSLIRALGLTMTYLTFILAITFTLWSLIPEIYKAIMGIVVKSNIYIESIMVFLNDLVKNMGAENILQEQLDGMLSNISAYLREIPSILQTTASNLISIISGIANGIITIVIGIIISIYFLASKENFAAQLKKVMFAVCSKKVAEKTLEITTETHTVFGKFIFGRIIESIIVAIICYLGMLILGLPYPVLISSIVGVTNLIPFFGPIIGAVMGAVLILFEDPMKMIIFLIFIVILQQFDGNVLGPKIVGKSVGLPAFWVIFAILVGGAMFGIVGILVAVPTFAVIYRLFNLFITRRLQAKEMPDKTGLYKDPPEEEIEEIEIKAKPSKRSFDFILKFIRKEKKEE